MSRKASMPNKKVNEEHTVDNKDLGIIQAHLYSNL